MIKMPRSEKIFRKEWIALILFFAVAFPVTQKAAELIKGRKPTHFEKNVPYTELVKVGELYEDPEGSYFLVRPTSVEAADDGSIFVYDAMFKKIYKFDKTFKYVKFFGGDGEGPGEFRGITGFNMRKLYFAKDGNLYACAHNNRRLMAYSKEGNLVKEIRLDRSVQREFFPAVDDMGNYFTISSNGPVVDMYNSKSELARSFLTRKHMERFVVFKPTPDLSYKTREDLWEKPSMINTYYDVLPGNRVIIYIVHSASVYIFKDGKQVKHFNTWTEEGIKMYTKSAKEHIELEKKEPELKSYFSVWDKFFVDKDDENYFYISGPWDELGRRLLYRFSTDGKLVEVLFNFKEANNFIVKRNNLFFSIDKQRVLIYKKKRRR